MSHFTIHGEKSHPSFKELVYFQPILNNFSKNLQKPWVMTVFSRIFIICHFYWVYCQYYESDISTILKPKLQNPYWCWYEWNLNEHSIEEWWERPTGFPKVGSSNPSSVVFPPKLSGPLAVICKHNWYHISVCATEVSWARAAVLLLWPMIVIYHSYTPHLHTTSTDLFKTTSRWAANTSSCVHSDTAPV